MDAEQTQTIARQAIKRVRGHYSPKVWDYVSKETRKGWVARAVVVNFAAIAPDTPAKDVAAVVAACDEIIGYD